MGDIFGVIYKITNIVNRKVYIGQTIYTFDKRYVGNLENNTRNMHLKRSIQKYGIKCFMIDTEFDIAYSQEELDEKEIYWIKYFDSTNPSKGYNKNSGGLGGSPTQEVKDKISNTLKEKGICAGENNPMYGVHRYGEAHPMYGKHHSEESKQKIKDNHADFRGKKAPNKRGVICLTTKKIFIYIGEARDFYGLKDSSLISACCRGRQKSAGKLSDGTKLVWRYLNWKHNKVYRIIKR